MFNLRSVFAFWAILVLFLGWSGRAEAQTTGSIMVTVPATGVRRAHQDYAGKVLPTQINYKDCLNEDVFTFTVNLGTGYSNGYSLEIWAGTSCENAINRDTTPTCWLVNSVVPNSINMVSLLGPGDEHLSLMEKAFAADLHVRGNQITLRGVLLGSLHQDDFLV